MVDVSVVGQLLLAVLLLHWSLTLPNCFLLSLVLICLVLNMVGLINPTMFKQQTTQPHTTLPKIALSDGRQRLSHYTSSVATTARYLLYSLKPGVLNALDNAGLVWS